MALSACLAAPAAGEGTFDAAGAFAALVATERSVLTSVTPGRLTRIATPARPLFPRRKAAETPPAMPSEVWISKQPTATGGPQWQCLTEALYFEARGESFEGVIGVAEVILNRVESRAFPDTVCGVVNEGTGQRHRCQFSYTCDGRPEHVAEPGTYDLMGKIARAMLDGAPRQVTGGATYFHTVRVNPVWAARLDHTTRIGDHKFYR